MRFGKLTKLQLKCSHSFVVGVLLDKLILKYTKHNQIDKRTTI